MEAAGDVSTPGEAVEELKWPQPVPEDWKQARGRKADEWFREQSERLYSDYHACNQAAVDATLHRERTASLSQMEAARVQALIHEQQHVSRAVQQHLLVLRQQRLEVNAEYKALRLPHFTPPRPLALITAPDGGPSFLERLFTRALSTTLLAAVTVDRADEASPSAWGGDGGAMRTRRPVPCATAVWCELGQNRVTMQDPHLARLEALERCQLAVVVLSPALQESPWWAAERRLLSARLAAPPGTWPGPPLRGVVIVRLHVPPTAARGPAADVPLQLPLLVPGYPVQSYPVVVLDMELPQPPTPAAEGPAAAAAMAEAVRGGVARVLEAAAADGLLAAASLRYLPDPPPVHLHPAHVHDRPDQIVLAAAAAAGGGGTWGDWQLASSLGASMAGGGGSLATQSPAHAAVPPGPAATAAHLLPAPHLEHPVEDWTMYDTVVWLGSLGCSLARWSPGLLALAVDGPLLCVLTEGELRDCCGVAPDRARAAILEALASVQRRSSTRLPSRLLLPGPDSPATPLSPEAAVVPLAQRTALLADIFAYYDQDHTGDLDLIELGRLVAGCGLRVDTARLKDILDDYDDDADGALELLEAERLLEDVWTLVMAQQDVAAWTPAEAADALKDAQELEWPLDTPRASPDADRLAAATPSLASIDIRGSPRDAAAAAQCSGTSHSNGQLSTASARDESGAQVHIIDHTGLATARASPVPASSVAASSNGGGGFAAAQARAKAALRATVAAAAGSNGAASGDGAPSPSASSSAAAAADSRSLKTAASFASYAWGLPPRLSVSISMRSRGHSRRVGGGGGFNDAMSMASAAAPWSGAITPKALKSGGRHVLSPEALAALDVDVGRLLRGELGAGELRAALGRMLGPLDLRRAGRVDLQMLRASLVTSGPFHQLTPFQTHLLSVLAEQQAQLPTTTGPAATTRAATAGCSGEDARRRRTTSTSSSLGGALLASGLMGEVLLGMEVAVQPYVEGAVQEVAAAQADLLGGVYGERGLAAMLRQMYRQSAGPDDPLELLARGPQLNAAASEAALDALMGVQGIRSTALVKAALLPGHQQAAEGEEEEQQEEDWAAAARASGAGEPPGQGSTPLALRAARRFPQAWSAVTAHVLHVYKALGAGQDGTEAV